MGNKFYEFLIDNFWVVQIIAAFLVIIILHVLLKLFISIVKTKSVLKSDSWKNSVDYVLLKPIHMLIWTIGIVYIIRTFSEKLGFIDAIKFIYPIRNVLIVAIVTWLILRAKKVFEDYIYKTRHIEQMDSATVDFIGKILTIIILFISFLLALNILGLNILPLVAFGGVGAAALGFAAKDVLANFFGGLMVYVTRPFKIGDQIEIPKEHIIGNVEHIGWYFTSVRNFEMCPMYVPNSLFSTSLIHNASRSTHRKIEEKIGLATQDFKKLSSIIDQIREVIKNDKDIDSAQSNLVFFNSISPYSLEIYLRIYTFSCTLETFHAIKQRIIMQVREVIYSSGAEIPFPTTTVNLQKQ